MGYQNDFTEQAALFSELARQFGLPGTVYACECVTNGNINRTLKVSFREPDGKVTAYIFQRINTYVFKKPVEIMANIEKVTEHIRNKVGSDRPSLRFYQTAEGKSYIPDADEGVWRVMNWIDAETFNLCEDPVVICATGEAFGEFQMMLSDFDGSVLYETIPDFHNTKVRFDTLFANVESDPVGRVNECREEIDYLSSIREIAGEQSVRFSNGKYPVRVTHNDTKSNNVLFDKQTHRPLTVIDLDTVMPGFAPNDFGDAIRFIANTAAEDEPDLSKVSCDTDKFRAFTKGFLSKIGRSWSPEEIDALVMSAFSMTSELAARFLADYLIGDPYFKCLYPEHNLVRARCQIHLAKDILAKRDVLEQIVRQYASPRV